jgi:FKBP-type peptidyl-prolyl cis-trans isomerase
MENTGRNIYIGLGVLIILGFIAGIGYMFMQLFSQDAKTGVAGVTDRVEQENKIQDNQTMFTELIKEDTVVGTGKEAKRGNTIVVNYTGKLLDGTVFDSSLNAGRTPFEFVLGAGMVIEGWDQGFDGMKEGGKRTLKIPSSMAYGARGAGALIKPNADLIFEVELLEVK